MVSTNEAIELLLQVCPDIKSELDEHRKDWEDEPPAYYLEISIFAHYVVNCFEKKQTDSFAQIFELVERLIVEGDNETQNLMIVGFIEDLQNGASWRTFGYSVFEPYLGPKSLEGWRKIETICESKDSLADVITAETKQP